MRKVFNELAVGDKFHTGKSKNLHGEPMFLVFQKKDKSKAVCVDQIGFYNKRTVGDIQDFRSKVVYVVY